MPPETAPGFADVSVVVAAYRAAGTIRRALISVARQTVKPCEVVVVDDGSDDGTADVARACAPDMGAIALRVFGTEDNRGAGAARNRAVTESRQPVLAFLDADDEWLPEKLERTLAVFGKGDYALVAHDYLTGNGDRAEHHRCQRRFKEYTDPFVGLYRKGYIASGSVVTRRDAVLEAGGFDEGLRNAQDFDLWLAMLRKPGARFHVFGEALLRYRPAPGGIMSHTRRRLNCGLAIAVRHFPALKERPGLPLMSLWFRVLALHWEAVGAYGAKGEIVNLLLTVAMLPVNLAVATVRCLAAAESAAAPATVALWLWVIAVAAAYLHQFRDFVRPFLALVGLA